jgi:CRISPR-associated protein Cas5/CasD subtype I-E
MSKSLAVKDAGDAPSKCGVTGLVCAALGVDRGDDDAISAVAKLRMGVRVDHVHPTNCVDYATMGGGKFDEAKKVLDFDGRGRPVFADYGIRRADGRVSNETEVVKKKFMQDAFFLVGLESGDQRGVDLLATIHGALARPVFQLSLGRRCFKPAMPIRVDDGLLPGQLEAELESFPWLPDSVPLIHLARHWLEMARRRARKGVRSIIEVGRSCSGHDTRVLFDVPVNFLKGDNLRERRVVRYGIMRPPVGG